LSRWFRVHDDMVDDPKVQRLGPDLFKALVNLWCLASQNNGRLPPVEDIAFKLRVPAPRVAKILEELQKCNLIDVTADGMEPHNWSARQYKSDVSTERVKRFRKRHETVSETPPETEADTETESKKKEAVADATRPKATRLPDDWTPTPDERRFAWGRGLSAAEIDTEAIKFRNYWTAKSGKDATKLDWSRTWQNWILNRRGTPNGQAKPNLVDAAKKLANTFADRPGNGLEEGGNLVRLLPQSGRG
jgi:hypothetical protein